MAITVPINIIIVTFFRSCRPKPNKDSKVRPSPNSSRTNLRSDTASPEGLNIEGSSEDLELLGNNAIMAKQEKSKLKSVNIKVEKHEKKRQKRELFLPYWCAYIAWALTFASIVISAVMVIIYGMTFGNTRSLEWLSSVTFGFVQDILLIQPVKVFVIAVLFALIVRKIEEDKPGLEQEGKKLAEDEEWLTANISQSITTAVDTMTLRPPDSLKLDEMRTLRFKERKMYAITREILFYSFFVTITFSISYSLREEVAFFQTRDLEELFVTKPRDGKSYGDHEEFNKVNNF